MQPGVHISEIEYFKTGHIEYVPCMKYLMKGGLV